MNTDHCRSLADLVGPVDPAVLAVLAVLAEGEAMLVEEGSQLRPEDCTW